MDDKKPEQAKLYDRRSFLSFVGVGCLGVTSLGGAILSIKYLSPNSVLEPSPKFTMGPLERYAPGSVTLDPQHKVFLVRAASGAIFSMSATCTHLGCLTYFKPLEGVIACPCHGSKFTKEGQILYGPAPRPLPRFYVELNDRSQLVVDRSQIVGENFLLKV